MKMSLIRFLYESVVRLQFTHLIIFLSAIALLYTPLATSQNKIELETLTIKGNTELPKILYLIPWQDAKPSQNNQRKLKLHSISDEIFDIRMPSFEEIKEIQEEKKALVE